MHREFRCHLGIRARRRFTATTFARAPCRLFPVFVRYKIESASCRLEIMGQPLGSDFSTPIRSHASEVRLFPPIRFFCAESARVKLGTQLDRIIGDPFFKQTYRLQKASIVFFLSTRDIVAPFEIQQNTQPMAPRATLAASTISR